MTHLDTAADHLSAAAAALRFALGESDSALASLAILRSLEKTMRAFNETSSLRDTESRRCQYSQPYALNGSAECAS